MNTEPTTEYELLSPEAAARIDETCDRFESAWKAARTPGSDATPPLIADYAGAFEQPERGVLIRELIAIDQVYRKRHGVAAGPNEYEDLGEPAVTPTVASHAASDARPQPEGWPILPGLKLEKVVGSGGMGVVFKGRQAALGRDVAVKLLRDAHLAGPGQRERFLLEAQSVARLHHPHLVQVYEFGDVPSLGGTTSQPYLVLEYVAGENLADTLHGFPLSAGEAAQLVETLAEAIHYAHTQGIIHRDLKPANILLASRGRESPGESRADSAASQRGGSPPPLSQRIPKITDFGLVKVQGVNALTTTGNVLGTPSYMAPEQTTGKAGTVTAAVDVYGLGAILYEALTGRPPFRAETVAATVLQVQHEEPIAPRLLQSTIPRDLDTICLKCLRKEPDKRYGTAQELADDLRRFRLSESILARPAGTGERLVRWCRRKPAVAALLVTLVVMFLGGFADVFWHWRNAVEAADDLKRERDKVVEQWERAERHLTKARNLVERLTQIADDLKDQPGLDQTARKLYHEALAFHQEILQEKGQDPAVRLEAARAFGRVADIHHSLRQWDKAETAYRAKIELMDALRMEFPDTVTHGVELAHAHRFLAHTFRDSGNFTKARPAYDMAIAIEEELHRDNPKSAGMRTALANSLLNSMNTLTKDEAAEVERRRLRVVDLQQQAVAMFPKNRAFRQELALGLSGLAIFHFERGQFSRAEEVSREALILRQDLHNEDLSERWFERYLAGGHRNLAGILAVAKPKEAEPQYTESINLLDKLTKDFPTRPIYRVELADTQVEFCKFLFKQARLADVEKLIEHALAHYEQLAKDHPAEQRHLRKLAAATLFLGQCERENSNYDRALRAFQKMLDANERLILQFKGLLPDRFNRAWDLSLISNIHELAGNPTEAERFMRQSIQEFRQLVNEFPNDANNPKALASREDELTRLLRKAGNP